MAASGHGERPDHQRMNRPKDKTRGGLVRRAGDAAWQTVAPARLRGGHDVLKEFKVFAIQGNVLDMAIGIIIGAAFGKIVTSFVSDILMPPIGMLLGRLDFSSLFVSPTG
jgi:hypothetical protein